MFYLLLFGAALMGLALAKKKTVSNGEQKPPPPPPPVPPLPGELPLPPMVDPPNADIVFTAASTEPDEDGEHWCASGAFKRYRGVIKWPKKPSDTPIWPLLGTWESEKESLEARFRKEDWYRLTMSGAFKNGIWALGPECDSNGEFSMYQVAPGWPGVDPES